MAGRLPYNSRYLKSAFLVIFRVGNKTPKSILETPVTLSDNASSLSRDQTCRSREAKKGIGRISVWEGDEKLDSDSRNYRNYVGYCLNEVE
ncbi:hypothetical protein TNCV_1862741 [Trichonephila clavipes]|nr:hypothetical protein TNCV_1862741 [Trichonephila clavipes]